MSFSSVNLEEKGPYTHTLTSNNKLFFVDFGTFWSKTRCLPAKQDTLTSKKSGRFQKLLYFCPSQNRFLTYFTGKNTYTHTLMSIYRAVFPFSKRVLNCRECMSVCVYFDDKTRQKHIHSYTHGNSRHTLIHKVSVSNFFGHFLSVSKNCCIFPFFGV